MPSVTSDVFKVVTFFLFMLMLGSNTTTSQFLALPAVCRHVVAMAALYSALVKRPMKSGVASVLNGSMGIVAITLLPASIRGCVASVPGMNDHVALSSASPTAVLTTGQTSAMASYKVAASILLSHQACSKTTNPVCINAPALSPLKVAVPPIGQISIACA